MPLVLLILAEATAREPAQLLLQSLAAGMWFLFTGVFAIAGIATGIRHVMSAPSKVTRALALVNVVGNVFLALADIVIFASPHEPGGFWAAAKFVALLFALLHVGIGGINGYLVAAAPGGPDGGPPDA